MKQAKPALRYAKAVLDFAKEKKLETEVNDNMKLIAETLAESDDLKIALKSSIISSSDKKKVLNALFGNKINSVTKGLFNILEENKRLKLLEAIAKKYAIVYDYDKNIQQAKVTTAVPLTKELEQKIQDKIVAITGYNATIENSIDTSILGGFILRVGDVQYDASISNQFEKLKKEFDNSQFIPKF